MKSRVILFRAPTTQPSRRNLSVPNEYAGWCCEKVVELHETGFSKSKQECQEHNFDLKGISVKCADDKRFVRSKTCEVGSAEIFADGADLRNGDGGCRFDFVRADVPGERCFGIQQSIMAACNFFDDRVLNATTNCIQAIQLFNCPEALPSYVANSSSQVLAQNRECGFGFQSCVQLHRWHRIPLLKPKLQA